MTGKRRLVLVVETDPVARRHLTSLLETWGYGPVVASSVDEALAILAHSHFLFSLLDLDLDGSDGNEILKLAQQEELPLPPETMERLMRHRYLGNIRELENLVKRMIVLGDPWLTDGQMPDGPKSNGGTRAVPAVKPGTVSLKIVGKKAAQAAERDAMLRALDQTRWNRLQAAKLLNISYRALLYKIKEAGLEPEHRSSSRQ